MDYKYHHKVLELLYDKKCEHENFDSRGQTIKSPSIIYFQFTAKMLSNELNIKEIKRSRSILTSLREYDCLNSRYRSEDKDVIFWITDHGISKYFEQYFVYKKKEQFKERLSTGLKIFFYSISTIGIIISIIYNFFNTRTLIEKIENQNSYEIKQNFDRDSVKENQVDSTEVNYSSSNFD